MLTIRGHFETGVYRTFLRILLAGLLVWVGFSLLGLNSSFLLAYLPMVIAVFFVEQYYSSPASVLTNTFALILLLIAEKDTFFDNNYEQGFWLMMSVGVILLISTFYLKVTQNNESYFLQQARIFVEQLGSAKFLYGTVFIIFLSLQSVTGTPFVLSLGFIFFLALFSKHIHKIIDSASNYLASEKAETLVVGKVESRQSPDMVTVKLFRDDGSFKKNKFYCLKGEANDKQIYLKYIDDVPTSEERFLRFSVFGQTGEINVAVDNFVYEIGEEEEESVKRLFEERNGNSSDRLVGVICDNSDIDLIKVKITNGADHRLEMEEGDLLSVNFRDDQIKYQVIGVSTTSEDVEGKSNSAYKIVSAQQLGAWDSDKKEFVHCSWVPDNNSLVFCEERKTATITQNIDNSYIFGVVPGSDYPIYYKFDEGICHHTAIIGRTGSGKSQMSANMIKRMVASGYKVFILEIDQNHPQTLTQRIDEQQRELVNVTWSQVSGAVRADFTLNPERPVAVISWEDAERTRNEGGPVSMAAYTAAILTKILTLKTAGTLTQKVCVVFEEAYDFIPENTFGHQNYGQPEVSRVSQLILKCRKHDIGALIITQRTALVTKTILYQCNTVIALQSFDETSKGFMGAYVNSKYLDSMSILPKFTCMVVGKGSSCDKPVIVDFEERLSAQVAEEDALGGE